jgi:hypothetical protein
MVLLHCALLCEAQAFIEFYKLTKINSKIYKNNHIVLLISGVGKQNTISTLDYMFINYHITSAINIGVAGCNNNSIAIGELFCTTHKLDGIDNLVLKTVDEPQTNSDTKEITLYDMEAKYFLDISLNYLDKKDIYIFKIVSDHLSNEILAKDFIKGLVRKHISTIQSIPILSL